MVMAPSAITSTCEETYSSKRYFDTLNLTTQSHGGKDNRSIEGVVSKHAVLDVLKKQVTNINLDSCQPGEEDAFFVADLGEVYRQHLRWKMNLARVKPFYGTFSQFPSSPAMLLTPCSC